jgi:hypothetical protein
VFQAVDPVRPNETALLFGANITSKVVAEGLRLADGPVNAPPSKPVDSPAGAPESLPVVQASDLSAKLLIPPSWKAGVFAVRLRNASGVGAWQFLNRPQLWWQVSGVGGHANPEGELRLFGKNFGPSPRVWLVSSSSTVELPVSRAEENHVAVRVPASFAPGPCEIWLHGGCGGAFGFASLPVEVAAAARWPDQIFDVRDFGASGNGRSDDTAAIRRALAWAGDKGGGIVRFPPGTYIVTGHLKVPRRTVVRGDDPDRVTIKVPHRWPDAQSLLPEFNGLFGGEGSFGIEGLTIFAQQVQRIVAAPDVPEMYGKGVARVPRTIPSADGVRLRNLRIRHLYFANRIEQSTGDRGFEGPSTVAVKGADFVLEDSEVVSAGMPIQILGAERARVSRNVLRTGRGWYGLWDFREGVFEDNDVSSGDLWGSLGGVQGSVAEVFFARNRFHHGFGGEREAITFDTPYHPVWMGRVEAAGTHLRLRRQEGGAGDFSTFDPDGLLVVVAGGPGLGGTARVKKASAEAIELAAPLPVLPGADSVVVLAARKSRVLVVDNVFEDASVSAQLYAQSHEFVITRNRAVRTGGSYANAFDVADSHGRRRYSYALFNQWLDNDFEQGLVFDQGPWAEAFVGVSSNRSQGLNDTTPAVGNRVARNRIGFGTFIGAETMFNASTDNLTPEALPLGRDMVIEGNTVPHRGVQVGKGQWFTLVRDNHTREKTPVEAERSAR